MNNDMYDPHPHALSRHLHGLPHHHGCNCQSCIEQRHIADELFKDKNEEGEKDYPPIEIPQVQPSLAKANIDTVNSILPLASTEELDGLINRIEALKTARFIEQRRAAEESIDALRDEIKQACWNGEGVDEFRRLYLLMEERKTAYYEASRAINAMIQRGVQL